jgi:hypothetical protein
VSAAEAELAWLTAATSAFSLPVIGREARAAGSEDGHAFGHNGGPDQGPDGANTSDDAFFS